MAKCLGSLFALCVLFGFPLFEGFADCYDGDTDEGEGNEDVHNNSWVGDLLLWFKSKHYGGISQLGHVVLFAWGIA